MRGVGTSTIRVFLGSAEAGFLAGTFFGAALLVAAFFTTGLFAAALFVADTGFRAAGFVFFGVIFLAAILLAAFVLERVVLLTAIFFAAALLVGVRAFRTAAFAAVRFVLVVPVRPLLDAATRAGAVFGREILTNPRIARPEGRAFTNAFTSERRVGLLREVDGMGITLVTVVARMNKSVAGYTRTSARATVPCGYRRVARHSSPDRLRRVGGAAAQQNW
jgi:hypothetical protein